MTLLTPEHGSVPAKETKSGFQVDLPCPHCHENPMVVRGRYNTCKASNRWLKPYSEPAAHTYSVTGFCMKCSRPVGVLQETVEID